MEFIAGLSEWGYIGLFLSAFLSGSIIPLSSEVVLGILLVAGFHPWGCLLTATAGNWLGGVTCYYIGHLGKIEKTQKWLQGKGALMAFFVFLPGIGDLIIVGLGLMRANALLVNISMLIGKFLRYYLIIIGVDYFSSLIQ